MNGPIVTDESATIPRTKWYSIQISQDALRPKLIAEGSHHREEPKRAEDEGQRLRCPLSTVAGAAAWREGAQRIQAGVVVLLCNLLGCSERRVNTDADDRGDDHAEERETEHQPVQLCGRQRAVGS